jgi:hypothetical protein
LLSSLLVFAVAFAAVFAVVFAVVFGVAFAVQGRQPRGERTQIRFDFSAVFLLESPSACFQPRSEAWGEVAATGY